MANKSKNWAEQKRTQEAALKYRFDGRKSPTRMLHTHKKRMQPKWNSKWEKKSDEQKEWLRLKWKCTHATSYIRYTHTDQISNGHKSTDRQQSSFIFKSWQLKKCGAGGRKGWALILAGSEHHFARVAHGEESQHKS